MKYDVFLLDKIKGYCEYHVTEGIAYLVCVVGFGNGFEINEVHEGKKWREGVGEECVYIADSKEEADERLDELLCRH